MVLGHYASAFLVRPHFPKAPFWLLLLASNLAEFLWLGLALAGIESFQPDSILDATFHNLKGYMIYSHNLIPNLVFGLLVFAVVQWLYKNRKLAFICAFLTCFHVWCDFIVGFEHEVLGRDSMNVSLNSYGRFPVIAIFIEWAFAMICLTYFAVAEKTMGRNFSRKKLILLFVAFTIGILVWLPNAYTPMRELLGL